MERLKFSLPCKVRCVKDFPAIENPTFYAGETLQVRTKNDGCVNVDTTVGGILSVPNKSFNDCFVIVVQVQCTTEYKEKTGDDQPLFDRNGRYWAALRDDGSYWVFFPMSPDYSSFGAKSFNKHFEPVS